MDDYAEVIGNEASKEDYTKIATHFESLGNHYKAGQFFAKGGRHSEVRISEFSLALM